MKATVKDWTFTSRKDSILDSKEIDDFKDQNKLPSIPDMTFGRNMIDIRNNKTGLSFQFNVFDALKQWQWSNKEDLKVAAADAWSSSHKGRKLQTHKNFDWSYDTGYIGTISVTPSENTQNVVKFEETEEKINFEKLKRPDQILFFDDVFLFEDELADSGVAMLSVKARAMPECWFGLIRYWLRIDDVTFKIIDARYYHEFNKDYVIREFQEREAPFASVMNDEKIRKDRSLITDPNYIFPLIPLKQYKNEKITVAPASSSASSTTPAESSSSASSASSSLPASTSSTSTTQ